MTHEVGSWGYDVELEAKKREQTDFSLSLSLSVTGPHALHVSG